MSREEAGWLLRAEQRDESEARGLWEEIELDS